ncbi:MAG TPA: ATP-binding cassette domain-containing protein [Bryobacteraceae bacterium]|jgi:phospholipid/cholesterol/gamma-HCH transport system ATP-binding protein
MEDHRTTIEVRDLHKSFGPQTVLDGIGFEVRDGETLAVMGRSGTGKSVLLKLLIGLASPDAGSVTICGRNIVGLNTHELNKLRKKIGFLFQQGALYDSLTIEQNVLFPMQRHTRMDREAQRQRARELLGNVGLEKDYDKLPSQISGGMQKRVGLARALALEPDIVLFDEPTSGLDPITAAEIGKLIVDLKQKRRMSAVVVTHDVRGARSIADRAVLMDHGKVCAEGSFDDLQNNHDPLVSEFLREGC